MASNFAFQAFGMSQALTVGGAAPVTVSLNCVQVGVTNTLGLTNGSYNPGAVRIVNEGSASVFIQFTDTAAHATVSPTTAMKILSNTKDVLGCRGTPFLSAVCASTFTVTLIVTPGEGIS